MILLAALDRFRIEDAYDFPFDDPSQVPQGPITSEIVDALTNPTNSADLMSYYERECEDTEMNPAATAAWNYIRGRIALRQEYNFA